MKKAAAIIICILLILTQTVPVTASAEEAEEGGSVFEVSTWNEFIEAFSYSDYQGEAYTVKLMQNLSYNAASASRNAVALVNVHVKGCFVTLDFNGHTLSCTDEVSSSDLESVLNDFIRINLHPIDAWNDIELRLTDSTGGGGVSMKSHRAYDNQLAALHIVDTSNYIVNTYMGPIYQTCSSKNKLTIDGGTYSLQAKTEKIGRGTNNRTTFYRGTVIADNVENVEINGGIFSAKSDGMVENGDDYCARELSAFATCSNATQNSSGCVSGRTVINGGTFISDGYALHHFDHSLSVNETRWMSFPVINGGIFSGSVGYVGMSFVYANYDTSGYGVKKYREKPAADIINNGALVRCIKGGKMFKGLDGLTLGDLHEAKSLTVVSDSLYRFSTLPAVTESVTSMERDIQQTERFEVRYDVPYGLNGYEITPYITLIPKGGAAITRNTAQKTVAYADYPEGLTVKAGITLIFGDEVLNCENTYDVTVTEEPAPAAIISQPASCRVLPGRFAEATVTADHAREYQWYYVFDGTPFALTDSFVAMLPDMRIEGYTSPTLRLSLDSVTSEQFYCRITGTDGTTTQTDRIRFTFGDSPSVINAGGGEYFAGGDAEFSLWAEYADQITWYVLRRQSGSLTVYTLAEFAELTGCEYETSHKAVAGRLHGAKVTFKHGQESWAGKYAVGYALENRLGQRSLDIESLIPFTLSQIRPVITRFVETQSCLEGESMTFSFQAEEMTSAEWTFEKADDEGIPVAYTLDRIRELFPDSSFEDSVTDGTATLTVVDAKAGLCEYTLRATAVGTSANTGAGAAQINVVSVPDPSDGGERPGGEPALLGDVDEDGSVTSTDARLVLQLAVGKIRAEGVKNAAASDVDASSDVTSTDARLILQYSVGKITAFPASVG